MTEWSAILISTRPEFANSVTVAPVSSNSTAGFSFTFRLSRITPCSSVKGTRKVRSFVDAIGATRSSRRVMRARYFSVLPQSWLLQPPESVTAMHASLFFSLASDAVRRPWTMPRIVCDSFKSAFAVRVQGRTRCGSHQQQASTSPELARQLEM